MHMHAMFTFRQTENFAKNDYGFWGRFSALQEKHDAFHFLRALNYCNGFQMLNFTKNNAQTFN